MTGKPAGGSPSLHVLFLSRLVPGKGLITAIQAFAILQRNAPAACMTIAGDGSERQAAESLVEKTGIRGVRFLGHVEGEAKERAFGEATLFLLTSESEGMPTSVIEAMAHALPVVTSAVGGLKDFFQHGTMGFMTSSRDPRDFADLMIRLSNDAELLSRMSAFNYAYARENFAASKAADRLNRIYDDIVRQDRLKKAGSRWHAFRRWRMERRIRRADESQLQELHEQYLNAGGAQERWERLRRERREL
ncbi:MAG TPA: glycosyltransferase [Woeseiaceae bacterium]|nr:glycosyltransferase [Woeseiaceae bacterium]